MSQFLQDDDNDNNDAKVIAIPRVFSGNSRANKRKPISIKRSNTDDCV